MTTRSGADVIAVLLKQTLPSDTPVVFGLPGVHNIALWPSCKNHDIKIVGSRHEQGCAYAADGFARTTGHLGVALVTTGPGAANTLGACGEAWASKSPVLVIATDIPTTQRIPGVYRGVLHECVDQAGMFAPVTKGTFVVRHVDEIASKTAAAIACALQAPQGPAYLEIPTDLLRAPCSPLDETAGPYSLDSDAAQPDTAQPGVAKSDAIAIATAHELLAHSTRPLLWVGGGAKDASVEIVALAERLGAPVITTFSSRGVVPAHHPLCVNGPAHEPAVVAIAESADLVVVIGSDLDHMNSMAWKFPLPANRIAINVDAADANKNYAMTVTISTTAPSGAGLLGPVESRLPWIDVAGINAQIQADLEADDHAIDALEFLRATHAALPAGAAIFCDMAINGYWLSGYYPASAPRSLHYPMGWGTLGFALPASIGAATAGRSTVSFCGDGGALFAIGELATVAQEQLPLTIVVVDDHAYGMLRYGHEHERDDIGTELSPVDFVAIARGFGIEALHVDGFGDQYSRALCSAVETKKPHLIHVSAALMPPRTTTPRWILK